MNFYVLMAMLTVSCQPALGGSTVNGIYELRQSYLIDNNIVTCQAVRTQDHHTRIVLVTPGDAWTKELIVSTSTVYGYSIKSGDWYGYSMNGLNSNMKYNYVDLGISEGHFAIQFLKAKTFGYRADYGTLVLPQSVRGHLIVFFWPNDAPGDHWNHFINILNQGQTVSSHVAGISSNVLRVGSDATALAALFG